MALVALALALLAIPASAQAQRRHAGTLERGDRGPLVAALQRRLHVPADGVFGRLTLHAVKRAQRRHGLTMDGIVGRATAGILRVRLPAPRRSVPRSRGAGGAAPGPRPAAISPDAQATLDRIAQCESGGDPRAVSADRRYFGKYQFLLDTWRRLGGHGSPARAPEAEQDARAAKLLAQEGTAPWGACA